MNREEEAEEKEEEEEEERGEDEGPAAETSTENGERTTVRSIRFSGGE